MALKKLSEQVSELSNPQRSDSFVKQFRSAVRDGRFLATDMPERITLPKQYNKRGGGSYQKQVKEMVFDATPEFEAWFDSINRELTPARKGGSVKLTVEAFESGAADFQAAAERTRAKMQASFEKGQSLGKGRAKTTRKPAKKK